MKKNGALRFSIFITLVYCIVGAALLFFLQLNLVPYIITLAGSTLLCFVSALIISNYFLFNRLDTINRKIEAVIKNKVYIKKGMERNSSVIDHLDLFVSRLIREKTVEIDNLKELERYRKEFLGDVAHELRSPIFNIQGYIHTLIEGALEDETVSKRFLDQAAKNIDHLSTLVEDLVTISRIEAGELKIEKAVFDLNALVHEIIEFQDLSARQKGIELLLKVEEGMPTEVVADWDKIKQVLINLIGNSIKYGRESGHTIINLRRENEQIIIEISDNGEGISEDDLPRIFERFYRVDKSRSRQQSGTGLGLAIAKHFIEAHGSAIEVTSHLGVGSIFSFHLQKAEVPVEKVKLA